jgi:hypothetical protein
MVAAEQIDDHGQWLSLREDALLPLIEQFFAERIFGPMRLDKAGSRRCSVTSSIFRNIPVHGCLARRRTGY